MCRTPDRLYRRQVLRSRDHTACLDRVLGSLVAPALRDSLTGFHRSGARDMNVDKFGRIVEVLRFTCKEILGVLGIRGGSGRPFFLHLDLKYIPCNILSMFLMRL